MIHRATHHYTTQNIQTKKHSECRDVNSRRKEPPIGDKKCNVVDITRNETLLGIVQLYGLENLFYFYYFSRAFS